MAKITQFDPPAELDDFDVIPHQRGAWSEFLSKTFDDNVVGVEQYVGGGKSQFYNPLTIDTADPNSAKKIVWRGFPLLIAAKHPGNKRAAWREADTLLAGGERPQDEYLEWFVERNVQGKITRVTFTCEGPEYWEAMAHGYPLRFPAESQATRAKGDMQKVLSLYQQHVSPTVQLNDLLRNGKYNRLNKWNTTHGIMHLNQRNNTLDAEINIAAFSTILRQQDGQVLTDADELIRCARYGQPGRASDPRIGADVNALARTGYAITLQNPVGLYMDSLDTTGWATPNGVSASRFWRAVRGTQGMTVRAIFEVPNTENYTVGDIQIGGAKIEYGGQLAEFIDMKLTGVACREGFFHNQAKPCESAVVAHLAAAALEQPIYARASRV